MGGTKLFIKQLGSHPHSGRNCLAPRMNGCGAQHWCRSAVLKDRKGGDPQEWPESLRVREYPRQSVPGLLYSS